MGSLRVSELASLRVQSSEFRVQSSKFWGSTLNSQRSTGNHGQAMVEFVIAILAVVIIVAGFFQFLDLAGEKGEIVSSIREEAGTKAMKARNVVERPDYILKWEDGNDEMRHTADDKKTSGSIGVTLGNGVVSHSANDDIGWEYIDGAVNDGISRLHGGASATALGFISVEKSKKIELYPAMRDWIVGRDTVTVGEKVWMPKLHLDGFDK